MSRSTRLNAAALASLALLAGAGVAAAEPASAQLNGFQEVPALFSQGSGKFEATLNVSSITYKLTYAKLGSTVSQAHIHFSQRGVNGGIMVFLCTNLGNGPPGTPACPASGSVSGMLSAADVVGPPAQNINAGQFNKVLQAIRAGAAYANVHTTDFPGGEIRGQIRTQD